MASIRRHKAGWRAEVARNGVRRSRVLPTKRVAQDWAAREEYAITQSAAIATRLPFADLMQRYANEVSPRRRGERWETIRLNKLRKDPLAAVAVSELKPSDFAGWRDRRLREVSAGSVRREMGLLSAVLSVARREWGLLSANPMEGVRQPPEPRARDRMVTPDEMERLALSAGTDLTNATARAFHAFRLACETAMRAGEIVSLRWDDVDLDRRVAHLRMTKNGDARDVPLSLAAAGLFKALPRGGETVIGLNSRQLDALWRKVRDRAAVEGLTFHDSRHYAITQLSRKLDVLALAKMVGHRNIAQLMAYYDASAEDLAKRLD